MIRYTILIVVLILTASLAMWASLPAPTPEVGSAEMVVCRRWDLNALGQSSDFKSCYFTSRMTRAETR